MRFADSSTGVWIGLAPQNNAAKSQNKTNTIVFTTDEDAQTSGVCLRYLRTGTAMTSCEFLICRNVSITRITYGPRCPVDLEQAVLCSVLVHTLHVELLYTDVKAQTSPLELTNTTLTKDTHTRANNRTIILVRKLLLATTVLP